MPDLSGLTDAGLTLARHAERILSTEAEAVEALERSRNEVSGVLRVGLFATAAAEILPLALQRVRMAHPELTVHSRDMDVDEVYDAVASGSVDLALGLDYPDVPIRRDPALRMLRLYRERFSLSVPAGSMDGRAEVSLTDTRDLGWIRPSAESYYGRAVRTACRRAGIEPDVRHEVTDTAATLALVEAGIGVSVVTDLMLRLRASRFDVVRLRERIERHIVVVFRSSAACRPTVAALVDVLRAVAGTRRAHRHRAGAVRPASPVHQRCLPSGPQGVAPVSLLPTAGRA
ncbi:LysR substrate-binding domain-containing protein [Streptomyces sp. NPDC053542]|uniref:LysR substrate-binding domain-containing protein n=1 Tax=Streptomyces sp. NPDC053542 TaxID=3365710 RepID=UPI0037D6C32A